MRDFLRPALVLLGFFTLLTGLVYPLVVTGVAQAFFAERANGSLIRRGDNVVGSSLIGQGFDDPKYFWSRPSATAPSAYNGAASTGSNLGPSNPALLSAARARIEALHAADPSNTSAIPVDLVTTSGSGLDPHESPEAALYQVARVARARQLDPTRVRALVEAQINHRFVGVLGEPVVNVLQLNLALDAL